MYGALEGDLRDIVVVEECVGDCGDAEEEESGGGEEKGA